MARILHLFDASAGWQQRIGAAQLTQRLPAGRFTCLAATTDGATRQTLALGNGRPDHWPMRFGVSFLDAPTLRRRLLANAVDVVHAWSIPAALVVAQASSVIGLTVELFDPAITDLEARKLRSIHRRRGFGIVCTSATIRRRLLEKGIAPEVCADIRPGVDFGALNSARDDGVRDRLGVRTNGRVFITPEPAVRGGGQFTAYWATAIRSFLRTDDRLILPGLSREQARIARLARQLGLADCLCCPGPGYRFEDLVANSDVLLMPSSGEVSTTAIGWAMAAGVPVIATALYATAELLGHKHNALLIKPDTDKRVAIKLAAMLDQSDDLRQARETARGQAYQVLGVRRYVDQHARLYDNLLAGNQPGEGVVDSAVDL